MASRLQKGKHRNCHHIVKRHAGNDHKRSHSHVPVKVLDNSHSQNGGAASVGGLYEFPLDIPGLQKEGKPNGNGDAAKRSHKAEDDHFGVPHFIEICLCNVQKQHGRQGNLKCELVHLGHKGVIIKSNFPKKISQH